MKLLLTMNLPYTRVHGGANRSNRYFAEALVERGHSVHAVVPALATPSPITHEQFLEELAREGLDVVSKGGIDRFRLGGVEIHAVADQARLRTHLTEQVRELGADWVLVSSEDPSQSLLEVALRGVPGRTVYLAHTPQMFPFGPESMYPGSARTAMIGEAAGIITISRFVADYIRRWAGFECFTNHPPHYGPGPFPALGSYDNPYVLLMNASVIKGLPIFLALARAMPDVRFATLAGYATAAEDRAALAQLANVTLLPNRESLDDILGQARALLMPSLWAEGFGMAAVDAMLRGVPVLAAEHGGLPEALMGTGFLLPVHPVQGFKDRLGGNMLPVPIVPEQDAAPWCEALRALLADRELHALQVRAARETALRFVASLGVEPFEGYLADLSCAAPRRRAGAAASPSVAEDPLVDLSPEQIALLILRLQRAGERRPSAVGEPPLVRVSRHGELPLSFGQQRLWFLAQLDPASPAYNMSSALRLQGNLDRTAVAAIFDEIVRRHEVLRTTFPDVDGYPTQQIAPPARHPVPQVDLAALPAEIREAEMLRLAREDALRPFDLAQGPVFRTTLVHLGRDEDALLLNIHHIVSDGWSVGILKREVMALYEAFSQGRSSPLPELPVQYADYSAWQRSWLQGPVLEEKLAFWRRTLGEQPPRLRLPFDRSRPAEPTHRGAGYSLQVRGALHEGLIRLAHRHGATLFMTFLAAFAALLHRYTEQERILFGSPVAGRRRPEVEGLIGFFVNTLVLRIDAAADLPFSKLLERVRDGAVEAFSQQDVPFEKIVEALQPERSLHASPLFQVMFAFQESGRDEGEPSAAGLSLGGIRRGLGRTLMDLMLSGTAVADRVDLAFSYSVDLFEAETIAAMAHQLRGVLEAVVADPGIRLADLPLAQESERERRLATWARSGALQAEPEAVDAAREQPGRREAEVTDKRSRLSEAKRALLSRRWRGRLEGGAPVQTVPRRGDLGPAPLSFAQQRLWFLWQLEPDSPAYNIPAARRLTGPLNPDALEAALREIVRRHEVLRTRFAMQGGEPVQIVVPMNEVELGLARCDLGTLSPEEREAEVLRRAEAEARRPFDLAQAPMVRATLLRTAPDEHVAVVILHHIAADGWSANLFVRELLTLYSSFCAGAPSPLAELPLQYADFAVWQRSRESILLRQLEYWREQLGGELPVLQMPTDRPRPALQTFNGSAVSTVLPDSLSAAARELARTGELTLFMVLLAAFQSLLHRYTGQDDILVGNPTANRSHAELEELIGFFVNTLVLRGNLAGQPAFRDLLVRTREAVLGAQSHQELPFERLVEELRPERDPSRSPVFQVMFVMQSATRQAPTPQTGLRMEPIDVEGGTAQFDLIFILSDTGLGLVCHCKYNTDLFDAATIHRLQGHFAVLLSGALAAQETWIPELPLMTGPEREQLLGDWNATATPYPAHRCIHEIFEQQADRTPDAPALSLGNTVLSYAELDQRANLLANYLLTFGVGPGILVGLSLERSIEMVVGVLAILKAGGAYVPLDPEYPLDRLSFLLEDAAVPVLVTREDLADRLPTLWGMVVLLDSEWDRITQSSGERPRRSAAPEDLAYLMYTSGSTGIPKGVAVPHRAVVRLVCETSYFRAGADDVFLQLAPISFDASTFEIWGALLNGARLAVMPPGQPSLADIGEVLAREEVTTLWLTAGLFHLIVDEQPAALRPVRQLLAGGDALSADHVGRILWELPHLTLINGYGPTESTTFAVCHLMTAATPPARPVPLGRPIANTRVQILDRCGQLVPVGVFGELCIAGDGLARGYHNQPAVTAERFIPDPASLQPGARLYRTGDLVRWRSDRLIEFAGRTDDQVKIRGFRVEPGEVAAALEQHPRIREVVVVVREDTPRDKRLVAYLVGRGAAPQATELHEFLRQRLPEFMLPSGFVVLEALPLTSNGKVDRRRLPIPEISQAGAHDAYVAPRTPVEEVTAEIWAQVLKLPRVGLHDDFFDLGGHSLLGTQVVSRMRDSFGVEISLRSLFEAPTVAGLAEAVEAALRQREAVPAPPLVPVARDWHLPLSFAQQRLWFLDQMDPGNSVYNVPAPVRLSGRLDPALLEAVLGEIARRHESLRTTFATVKGKPVQVVAPWTPFVLPRVDLSGLPPADREAEALILASRDVRRPFDLASGPLLRVTLVQLEEEEQIVLFNMHHIVSDGWSISVLLREIRALYEAFAQRGPSPLPELPLQYPDFAVWQREWLQGEALDAQLRYWRGQLEDAPDLRLPVDRPRSEARTQRGASYAVSIDAELTGRLKELGRGQGATLFMTLLAVCDTLLYRLTGQEDIVVGSPIANRNRAETEGLIGFFVNTLALRTRFSGEMTFRQLLERTKEVALGAYVHQDLPFEKVVEELQPDRDLRQNPIFQVAFALQNTNPGEIDMPGLRMRVLGVGTGTVHFDLIFSFAETHDGLVLSIAYRSELFTGETILRMLRQLTRLLEQVAADPDQPLSGYRLLDESETGGFAPEDFPDVELSQKGLEDLLLEISG
jgi:amino acid adenylation domain-containing protein